MLLPPAILRSLRNPRCTGIFTRAASTFSALASNGKVDSRLIQAITHGPNLKFDTMSEVQEVTLPHLLSGSDLLAHAKTGTGKTIAFLLPAIQRMIAEGNLDSGGIKILVISPTRELAAQIAEQSEFLTAAFPEIKTLTAIGGNRINSEMNRLVKSDPQILVATPGRLKDYLVDSEVAKLIPRFSSVTSLVLDEADRLLDGGFKPDIDAIVKRLPKSEARQTVLFSATVSDEVKQIAKSVLLPNHKFISTVSEQDANTHKTTPQFLVTLPKNSDPLTIYNAGTELIMSEYEKDPENFKAMVFLPTARETSLWGKFFQSMKIDVPISDIHSRKSQPTRSNISKAFHMTEKGILFSSDVTARGMDFPNVSHVFQFGLPASGEQYIHRLGRTGRAGKSGVGYTVLYPHEAAAFSAFKELRRLPIQPYTSLTFTPNPEVRSAILGTEVTDRERAYVAWLGYNKGFLKKFKWTPEELVSAGTRLAREAYGFEELPGLYAKTVGMMGLKGVPGLRIVKPPPKEEKEPKRGSRAAKFGSKVPYGEAELP